MNSNKLLFKALCILMLLLSSSLAHAYDFEVDGCYYTMLSSSDRTVRFDKVSPDASGDFVIPETITISGRALTVISIGKNAFKDNKSITSVHMPNTVVELEYYAMSQCSLKNVYLSENLTKMGYESFWNSNFLESIDIPSGVKKLDFSTFSDCSNLKKVKLHEGLEYIGSGCFKNCI